MCKIDFMPNFKKIFIFTVLFLTFIGANSYSEVIKKIEIKENLSGPDLLNFHKFAPQCIVVHDSVGYLG